MNELQMSLIAAGVLAVVGVLAFNKWQEHKHSKHAERTFRTDTRDVLFDGEESPAAARREPMATDDTDDPSMLAGDLPEPSISGLAQPAASASESAAVSTAGAASAKPAASGKAKTSTAETRRAEPAESANAARSASAPTPGEASRPRAPGGRSRPGMPQLIDPRGECAVCIECIEPLDAAALWPVQADALAKVGKTLSWFAFDDAQNEWVRLDGKARGYHRWYAVSLQLADRRGPLSEEGYRQFADALTMLGDRFMAIPADLPSRAEVLARASELDQFCASVDVQIAISVIASDAPFAGTKVRGMAEAGGLALRQDGVFQASDDEGHALFVLANLEPAVFSPETLRTQSTRGLTLMLDLPRVAQGAQTFDRMTVFAQHLAESLNGQLVDDNRKPLGDSAVNAIRTQINQYQQGMREFGVLPGSPLARRLFS